jgi:hypothetical protein
MVDLTVDFRERYANQILWMAVWRIITYGMRHQKEEGLAGWRGLVSGQVASGTSVAAFCRDRGLRDWQFYEWKKRLRSSAAAPFIAVEVASTESASARPGRMSGIEIRHRRGWSLMVEPGFDANHLRRLLAVLEIDMAKLKRVPRYERPTQSGVKRAEIIVA